MNGGGSGGGEAPGPLASCSLFHLHPPSIKAPGACSSHLQPWHLPEETTAPAAPAGFSWRLWGALLRTMLGRQLVCWHLLALLFLPFCLSQDEYMEVSGRANNAAARIVQSHHQTGRSGTRREKVRERSHLKTGTVVNNTSTDLKSLRPDELPHPEVDDLAQSTPFWGQVLRLLF